MKHLVLFLLLLVHLPSIAKIPTADCDRKIIRLDSVGQVTIAGGKYDSSKIYDTECVLIESRYKKAIKYSVNGKARVILATGKQTDLLVVNDSIKVSIFLDTASKKAIVIKFKNQPAAQARVGPTPAPRASSSPVVVTTRSLTNALDLRRSRELVARHAATKDKSFLLQFLIDRNAPFILYKVKGKEDGTTELDEVRHLRRDRALTIQFASFSNSSIQIKSVVINGRDINFNPPSGFTAILAPTTPSTATGATDVSAPIDAPVDATCVKAKELISSFLAKPHRLESLEADKAELLSQLKEALGANSASATSFSQVKSMTSCNGLGALIDQVLSLAYESYIQLPAQVTDNDFVDVVVSYTLGNDSTVITRKYEFPVLGGFKIDFTPGIYVTNLANHSYSLSIDTRKLGVTRLLYSADGKTVLDTVRKVVINPDNTRDTVPVVDTLDGRSLVRDNNPNFSVALGGQLNMYYKAWIDAKLGLALGVMYSLNTMSATTANPVGFTLGGTFIYGRAERLSLSGGVAFAQLQRLRTNLHEGVYYPNSTFGTGTTPDSFTRGVWKGGLYFSLGYNLRGAR